VGIEGAAQLGVYTEDREVIRRNMLVAETLGLCTAGEVHVGAGAGNRHGLEYAGTLQVSPLRYGDTDVLRAYAGKIVLERTNSAGFGYGKGCSSVASITL
jgi:hypothetical protein